MLFLVIMISISILLNLSLRNLFPLFKKTKHAEENHLRHETSLIVAIIVLLKCFFFILKELRNRISRIIRLWSLFCSIRVYASLHFLLIHLENSFFIFLRFLLFLTVMCRI